ncbi:MAG: tetratricopeptide repeat protein [Myxococcota bacterium]|jgi:TolA-binding protein|nr:tetratricopeptide repeat protein [Myxococcota bacterium]
MSSRGAIAAARHPGRLSLLVALLLAPAGPSAASPPAPTADQLQELQETVRRYEAAARDVRLDVRRIVELKYEEKRQAINRTYEGRMQQLDEDERSRRLDAIARFEEFLVKYPDNEVYTPDAMFRLAELYFDQSNDDYLLAVGGYEDELADFEAGKRAVRPEEAQKDYRKTIELLRSLIGQFPRYRFLDGALYLHGYCLTETGQEIEGKEAFVQLVTSHGSSRFAPEAWMRIGEHYFDYNELEPAAAAYLQVMKFTDSAYYDRALYKLAWTYYRMDDFDQAIARFMELVEYADAHKSEEGTSDLRPEAVQYLAVSLAEEDWDGDGEPDPEPPVQRTFRYLTGKKPHEVEVLRKLGDIFYDNTRYADAAAIYRYLLQQFPRDPGNPEVHGKIVVCLERLQRRDDAMAEREALSQAYGKDSAWYQQNQNDRKAVRAAEQLTEEALIAAAVYNHDKAQSLKDRAKVMGDAAALAESKRYYEVAARNYEEYLRRYPLSKNSYDLNFYYADCLYFSFHFKEAAAQYAKVRDAEPEGKYREEAAVAAVLSTEQQVEGLIKAGKLPYKASPSYDPAKDPETRRPAAPVAEGSEQVALPAAEEIPAEVLELIAARDAYVKSGLTSKQDPELPGRMAFKAAEVYYRFRHYDEARLRFEEVIRNYPKEGVASLAASYLIESYRLTRNWEKMAEVGDRVAALNLGTPEERDSLKREVTTLKVGALFKKAEALFQEKKYEEAAGEYTRLVNENPGNEFADRALNNAAVAYENLNKYESAMRLYERVWREYPNREFAEHALYRTAVNSERFFNWQKATQSYLLLVDKFPRSDKRADSLYTAAMLQENTQQYREAIASYNRYLKEYPDRPDVAAVLYQTALIYEKMNDTNNMSRVFNAFIRKYGKDPQYNGQVMAALGKMADKQLEQGRWKDASALLKQILREFDQRGLAPGGPEALHAAKAQFLLTEQDYKTYEAIKIEGGLAQQGETIRRLQAQSRSLSERFAKTFDYKNLDWTLAAYFRMASLFQKFAEKLYAAPVPAAIASDDEAAEEFRVQLEDVAVPIEDEAVKRFEKAVEVARENRIVNEWTQKALQTLNKYKPAEYPLLRQERRETVDEPRTGYGPLTEPRPIPTETKPALGAPGGPGGAR